MTTCINLQDRFGDKYRISFDEADDRERRVHLDPWLLEIRGRRGTIYPYGGDTLAVMVDGRAITAGKLASLPGLTAIQDGDREKTFLFDVTHFDKVAAIVLPYRKRQVSDAERERLAGLSALHGFKSRQSDTPQASNSHAEASA